MSAKHKIAVYGTLRPNKGNLVTIPGKIFNIGWFPGLIMDDSGDTVQGEWIEADDQRLKELDSYEGYNENRPDQSLYVREKFQDGWIYVYNRPIGNQPFISSGDWLKHTKQAQGVAA